MRILHLTDAEYDIMVSILEDVAGEAQNAIDAKVWEDASQNDESTEQGYRSVIALQKVVRHAPRKKPWSGLYPDW